MSVTFLSNETSFLMCFKSANMFYDVRYVKQEHCVSLDLPSRAVEDNNTDGVT
jgi:hypothetical protein